ncbi:MAG: hypothetical protein NDJ75_06170 [Thermoanaerobaculia bacterium]|nr:hypothetical protein [Thermoanaerobaculia bacterium]
MIGSELQQFLESGVSVLVGTRDRLLVPEAARGFGLRVEAGGSELSVFLPHVWGARTVANLRDNARIAVAAARPQDHRSVQVKGAAVDVRDGGPADHADLDRYRERMVADFAVFGYPPRILHRFAVWPCHVVRLRVEALFEQTPGPRAGAPLAAGGAS